MRHLIFRNGLAYLKFDEWVNELMESIDASFEYLNPEKDRMTPSRLAAIVEWVGNRQYLPTKGWRLFFDKDSMVLKRDEKLILTVNGLESTIPYYNAINCKRAKELYAAGRFEEAWSLLVYISQSAGAISVAFSTSLEIEKHYMSADQARTWLAKVAAKARHLENRAMKAEVFVWLDSNMTNFESMDSAAKVIAEKIAPIAFRTARDWVGEWKKIRSAGTP